MKTDGELNTLALAEDARTELLTHYNYQLIKMCIKLRDELYISGMSLHLVKEATDLINKR
jgi:hypothetical protein